MTANAAVIWLDVLENLPEQTVVIFTTNTANRIPARLRDRCERHHFESGWLVLMPHLQLLADRVWRAEVGEESAPDVYDFGQLQDDKSNVSVRRLLQLMTPWVRAKKRPPRPTPAPTTNSKPATSPATPPARPAAETPTRSESTADPERLDWAA